MLSYILKVTLCWSLFYLLYQALLSKETFFKINRWYLLGTALLAIALPAIDMHWFVPVQEESPLAYYLQPITIGADQLENVIVTASAEPRGINWWGGLTAIYWLGAALALLRLCCGMIAISSLYRKGEKLDSGGYRFVSTPTPHVPFSFFKNLFWSNSFLVDEEDKQNILRHEEAHIFQWHSLDVLLMEILSVFFWCSPFIYLYKKAVKTNHEYLADDFVIAQANLKNYGRLLLRQSQFLPEKLRWKEPVAITNSIFSSQLKQRIVMMTKTKSTKSASLKYLAGLPLLALMLVAFSYGDQPTLDSFQTPAVEHLAKKTVEAPVSQPGVTDTLPSGEIFKEVEVLPQFPGCEEVADQDEQKLCWQKKMLTFIYQNVKYPKEAREAGIEGMAVVQFIVEKDGSIADAKIVRSIGGGCDEEVLKVVYMMPNWIPGKQAGEPVRVQFNLPVKFKLDPKAASDKKKVADSKPLFAPCEDAENQVKCANGKMFDFIIDNLKYPKAAKEAGVEGMVVVKFKIAEDGAVQEAKVVKGIGGGCDEEALRVVNLMPNWVPATQDGKRVATELTLPFKFALPKDEPEQDSGVFEVYPNPSGENGFTLKYQTDKGPIRLKVTDMAGRELSNIPVDNYDGTVQEARFDGLFKKKAVRGNVVVSILDGNGVVLKSTTVVMQ